MSINRKEIRIKAQKKKNTKQLTAIAVIVVGVLVIIAALVLPNFKGPVPSIPASALTNPPTDSGPTQSAASNVPTQPAAPTVAAKQYAAAPPMTIDVKKQYFANFKMAKGGEFVVQLFPDKAPITVNSFVFLAKDGFFNGVTFHRVLESFMAQGGDPTGTGMGGPGYEFVNENSDLKFDKPGVLAMANSGPNTNGSQFFIIAAPAAPQIQGRYTVFAKVIRGMDVVDAINKTPTKPGDIPVKPVVVERIALY